MPRWRKNSNAINFSIWYFTWQLASTFLWWVILVKQGWKKIDFRAMPSSHNAVSFRSYFCDWVLCPWHECSTRNKSSLYPTIHQKKCRHISWIIFSLSTWGCFVAQNGDVMYLYNKKIWAWRVGLLQSTNHGLLKN